MGPALFAPPEPGPYLWENPGPNYWENIADAGAPTTFIDSRRTLVELKAFPIGKVFGTDTYYGHAFVQYTPLAPRTSWVTRAEPYPDYAGGLVGGILNRADGVSVLRTQHLEESKSSDYERHGTKVLQSVVVDMSFNEMKSLVSNYNRQANSAEIPYRPQGESSNDYAGSAFQLMSGVPAVNNSDIYLPDLESGLQMDGRSN